MLRCWECWELGIIIIITNFRFEFRVVSSYLWIMKEENEKENSLRALGIEAVPVPFTYIRFARGGVKKLVASIIGAIGRY